MKRMTIATALFCAAIGAGSSANATPKFDVCKDVGPTFSLGISHFSAAGDWAEKAETNYGANWRFMYWYLVPVDDLPALATWMKDNAARARSLDAIPVFTFYHMLQNAQKAGMSGDEPTVVKNALKSKPLMKKYFDDFIWVLQTLAKEPAPVILHVEPDTWGFMIWAMGVEGNSDPTSVQVMVKSSGHPDVAGLPNNAAGLGRALVKLRDKYAPNVRLGWHASNFRTGNGGDIVASFYSKMGPWDVLVSEHPHNEADDAQWWKPWDPQRLQTNLNFFSKLTTSAQIPLLLWQMPIGTTDYHMLNGDPSVLTQYANAGVVGLMFELLDNGNNPDAFRSQNGALGTVPPAGSSAGGTAADMRARAVAYAKSPLSWPAGSICKKSPLNASGAGAADEDEQDADTSEQALTTEAGVGCTMAPRGGDGRFAGWMALSALALGAGLRRRRRA
jgi:MYXO-CTERM domain-containing protein